MIYANFIALKRQILNASPTCSWGTTRQIPLQLNQIFSAYLIYSFCRVASKATKHPHKQANITHAKIHNDFTATYIIKI